MNMRMLNFNTFIVGKCELEFMYSNHSNV